MTIKTPHNEPSQSIFAYIGGIFGNNVAIISVLAHVCICIGCDGPGWVLLGCV